MKRAVDITVALLLLLVLSPVFVVVAVAIAWGDGRPIFFHQVRIGKKGMPFRMHKFRSMAIDVAAQGGFSTMQGDVRITRVGQWIRRTSLDELPQLINVILGDMSLVGPRPDVPEQQALYLAEDWSERCSVRPGITGLAQASLRSLASPAQRLALDLQYVRTHTLLLDFKILCWSLRRLSGQGSN